MYTKLLKVTIVVVQMQNRADAAKKQFEEEKDKDQRLNNIIYIVLRTEIQTKVIDTGVRYCLQFLGQKPFKGL